MRILRIADVPDVRTQGMQRLMYGIGDELRAQGHTVDDLFQDDIWMPVPQKLRRLTVPIRAPLIVRTLARRGREYDVVEVHEPLGAWCSLMRRVGGRFPPVVVYSYGLEERYHQVELDYRRRKALPISLKNRWSPLSVILQARYAVRKADGVICSNAEDLRYLLAAGVDEARLVEVPSGIASEFLEAEPDWTRDPRSVLFVGTWILRKGVVDLVPATVAVLRRELRARLTLAGCGLPGERVLAEFPSDVRDRIAVMPLSSEREHVECYRRHAIFVLPSIFEGYPLAMLQAAALGLAVVTTDVCGMAEFVENGKNGIKVPVGDPERLAAALLQLVQNPPETRRLGEGARAKAQEFPWSRAAGLVLGVYERSIRNNGKGRSPLKAPVTRGPASR